MSITAWIPGSLFRRRRLPAACASTWNTNITSARDLFSRMAGSFSDASHEINQPLDQVVLGNVHNLFPATPLFVYQPRASFAYQLLPRSVIHGGFGVFSDIIPMQIADLAAMNAPNDPTFVGGMGGQVGGVDIAPGVPWQRRRCYGWRQHYVSDHISCRRRSMRGHSARRGDLSARREPRYVSRWNAQNAVLLPVQPRHRATDGRAWRRAC